MIARWRERAMREVRDELDRFLNFPLNQAIRLGDYGTYDGKRCRFRWEGNLSQFGIDCQSSGFQHEIAETYATAGAVQIQGRLGLDDGPPFVDVTFRRARALAFRGARIGFDQAQLKALTADLVRAIQGGLAWDRKKVIVTSLWQAGGFTSLVSGGSRAGVQIEASAAGATTDFNFADPALGLNVTLQKDMSYCAVGEAGVRPYFAVHKLREQTPGNWSLYRYGHPV
jgi:hypothetical protein